MSRQARAWQTLQRRIDALTLRERAFMFASAAVVAVAVADALCVSPLLARQRAASAALAVQAGEVDALRQQVAAANATASADSPAGRLQAALRALREERTLIERELAPPPGAQAPQLSDLLSRVLQRHERLVLVRLDVAAQDAAASSTAGSGDAAGAPTRPQAVDLAVQGSYPDLVGYLSAIEAQLPGLRWGPLLLSGGTGGGTGSGAEAPLLTLRVYLPASTAKAPA